MLLIHNPRCSKSREALALLKERGVAVEVREYLQAPLSASELEHLLIQLDLPPQAVIRFKDELAKSLGLAAGDARSRAAWIALLAEHPALLERPIAVRDGRALVARPPERVLELLD
ncbi:arsenate reductase (glutaredoxin) [Aquimonas voraii]|uniref:Arsenate reductase n=1 Tax=Aquimonas voraii TaxID=265719 RepID=A0A1G6U056_9GAMM|nr:arsenate reductase (glutaredoxin) [Aquimonas voraii]SDD34729.1 arsenate reductase [Aquimonas voraii]